MEYKSDAEHHFTGPRVSPSGHLSRRCRPAPDPKGFALWTPNRHCRPVPGAKGLLPSALPPFCPKPCDRSIIAEKRPLSRISER